MPSTYLLTRASKYPKLGLCDEIERPNGEKSGILMIVPLKNIKMDQIIKKKIAHICADPLGCRKFVKKLDFSHFYHILTVFESFDLFKHAKLP